MYHMSPTYSVVKTIEEEETFITAVPDSWVDRKKDVVFYPPARKAGILRNKGGPPTAEFEAFPCVVLYTNLTKQQAFQKEAQLSETESSSEDQQPSYKRMKTTNNSIDYTDLMQQVQSKSIINMQNSTVNQSVTPLVEKPIKPLASKSMLSPSAPVIVQIEPSEYVPINSVAAEKSMDDVRIDLEDRTSSVQVFSNVQISDPNSDIFDEQDNGTILNNLALIDCQKLEELFENQTRILNQQAEIIQGLAINSSKMDALSLKMDGFVAKMGECPAKNSTPMDNGWNKFPIKDDALISEFESFLSIKEKHETLTNVWSVKLQSMKKCNNVSLGYPLCDAWFDRALLRKFSWTGVSHIKGQSKLNFSALTFIVKTFGTLVGSFEKDFDCQKFFQNGVLKYSNSRDKSKLNNKENVGPNANAADSETENIISPEDGAVTTGLNVANGLGSVEIIETPGTSHNVPFI